jgi:hypothetical protein
VELAALAAVAALALRPVALVRARLVKETTAVLAQPLQEAAVAVVLEQRVKTEAH